MILRYASKRDLSHEFAPKTDLVIGIAQIDERLEDRIAGTTNHSVNAPDTVEHSSDGGHVFESKGPSRNK
jgi:hypothetical protein